MLVFHLGSRRCRRKGGRLLREVVRRRSFILRLFFRRGSIQRREVRQLPRKVLRFFRSDLVGTDELFFLWQPTSGPRDGSTSLSEGFRNVGCLPLAVFDLVAILVDAISSLVYLRDAVNRLELASELISPKTDNNSRKLAPARNFFAVSLCAVHQYRSLVCLMRGGHTWTTCHSYPPHLPDQIS